MQSRSTNAPVLSAGVVLLICTTQARGNKPTKKENWTTWLSWVSATVKHLSGQVLAACPHSAVPFSSSSNRRWSWTLSELALDRASVLRLQWNGYCCNLVVLGKKPHQDDRRIKLQKTTLRAPVAALSWIVDRNPFAGVLCHGSRGKWLKAHTKPTRVRITMCCNINIHNVLSWRAFPHVSSTTTITLF